MTSVRFFASLPVIVALPGHSTRTPTSTTTLLLLWRRENQLHKQMNIKIQQMIANNVSHSRIVQLFGYQSVSQSCTNDRLPYFRSPIRHLVVWLNIKSLNLFSFFFFHVTEFIPGSVPHPFQYLQYSLASPSFSQSAVCCYYGAYERKTKRLFERRVKLLSI